MPLLRGKAGFFPLLKRRNPKKQTTNKKKLGGLKGQMRWPKKRRVYGQLRWPFGPPHLTLKPSTKKNQKDKTKKELFS